MSEGSVHFSYDALSARTIPSLRRLMLNNNAKHGISFGYTDFSFVNGKWYCWYRKEMKSDDQLFKGKPETSDDE